MVGTMELIASATVGSGGASSIDFTGIPQTYTDLSLHVTGRSSRGEYIGTFLLIAFNGSTSGYTYRILDAQPSSLEAYNEGSFGMTSAAMVGTLCNNSTTANTFASNFIYIPAYTSSNGKSLNAEGVGENDATAAKQFYGTAKWANSDAITSISLKAFINSTYFDFLEHSTAYLYGIKKS